MTATGHYQLADSTYVEPLVNAWSAWASLIAPLPAGLHLLHYQLPLLRSYVADPEQHARASADPMFVGAPFASVPPGRRAEMQQLLERSETRLAAQLALARAATDVANRLAEMRGETLEPLYDALPAELRGLVELVYDYHHRASLRTIEPLLYESHYYDESLQSLRLATLHADDDRRYFLNTPRLPQPDAVELPVPFRDAVVDDLFRLDVQPQPLDRIREMLGTDGDVTPFLAAAGGAPASPRWSGDAIRIRYFGHACVLAEWRGAAVLTDPLVGTKPAGGGIERYGFSDLPAFIDVAIVTHAHQDHFNLETLLRLRHRTGVLVVPRAMSYLYGDISLKLLAERLGFGNVVEAETLSRFELPDGEIVAVPFLGEHSDVGHSKSAYVVRMGRRQVLVAADSDCLDVGTYEQIRRILGRVDVAFLGMESVGAPMSFAYGTLFPRPIDRRIDESRRQHGCNSERGKRLLKALGTTTLFGYAMGLEPWLEFILGLGITEDSEQWRESERLLDWARLHGFAHAERLYARRELFLDPSNVPPEVALPEVAEPATPAPAPADEFAF